MRERLAVAEIIVDIASLSRTRCLDLLRITVDKIHSCSARP